MSSVAAGCSLEVEGLTVGTIGTTSSGVLTENLFVLPRVTGNVDSGMTGWSLEVEVWSSGAVGTTSSGVMTEDLRVLPRVTRDVNSGLRGWSVGMVECGSRAKEETAEGVFLEDPWSLTLDFEWRGSMSEDKVVSGTS